MLDYSPLTYNSKFVQPTIHVDVYKQFLSELYIITYGNIDIIDSVRLVQEKR